MAAAVPTIVLGAAQLAISLANVRVPIDDGGTRCNCVSGRIRMQQVERGRANHRQRHGHIPGNDSRSVRDGGQPFQRLPDGSVRTRKTQQAFTGIKSIPVQDLAVTQERGQNRSPTGCRKAHHARTWPSSRCGNGCWSSRQGALDGRCRTSRGRAFRTLTVWDPIDTVLPAGRGSRGCNPSDDHQNRWRSRHVAHWHGSVWAGLERRWRNVSFQQISSRRLRYRSASDVDALVARGGRAA